MISKIRIVTPLIICFCTATVQVILSLLEWFQVSIVCQMWVGKSSDGVLTLCFVIVCLMDACLFAGPGDQQILKSIWHSPVILPPTKHICLLLSTTVSTPHHHNNRIVHPVLGYSSPCQQNSAHSTVVPDCGTQNLDNNAVSSALWVHITLAREKYIQCCGTHYLDNRAVSPVLWYASH
jgi:hypothetical protein